MLRERKRRAPVGYTYAPCAGCHQEVLHEPNDLCRDCRSKIDKLEQLEQDLAQQVPEETVVAFVPAQEVAAYDWVSVRAISEAVGKAVADVARDIFPAVLGRNQPWPGCSKREQFVGSGIEGHWNRSNTAFPVTFAAVTPRQLAAWKRLVALIGELLKVAYLDGEEHGRNTLSAFAAGCVSESRFAEDAAKAKTVYRKAMCDLHRMMGVAPSDWHKQEWGWVGDDEEVPHAD